VAVYGKKVNKMMFKLSRKNTTYAFSLSNRVYICRFARLITVKFAFATKLCYTHLRYEILNKARQWLSVNENTLTPEHSSVLI